MRNSSRLADAANGVMCLLVALYGAALVVLTRGSAVSPLLFAALAAGLMALCMLASRRFGPMGIDLPEAPDKADRRVFFAAAGFSLLVSLIYLWAFFPGGFSSDTTTQWHQIQRDLPLDNWHPALHTIIFCLFTRTHEHPASFLFLQGVAYACAVGYCAMVMCKWRVPKALVLLTALYLSANPAISNIMAFPWKDCAFAIAALFLAGQLFEVHCSGGKWLLRPWNLTFTMLTLTLCAIFRHNGVALSLAAGVWLIVSFPKLRKFTLMTVVFAVVYYAIITGPLYAMVDVKKNATPLDETIGLPMTVLSHVYVNAPESLDEETVSFLETMATRETYAEHHVPGDWNETKWFVSPLPEGHGYTLPQVFGFAARAALAEPALAIEALGGLFDLPLLLAGEAPWRMTPYVDPSAAQFGFEAAHHPFLSRALNWLCRLSASPAFSWLCWRPGVWLLLVMAACVAFARRRPLSALLLPAMLIAYHLATSLMLSSPTDFRFFLPTLLCAPLALSALVMRPQPSSR